MMVPHPSLHRFFTQTPRRFGLTTTRSLAMKAREEIQPLPPNFSMDSVCPPPNGIGVPQQPDVDPMALKRKPVTAAYTVDVGKSKLSGKDSAAFAKSGVEHGTLGSVKSDPSVPLEYLALLRPASEGAAALREMKISGGTVLIYGASRPAGMTATQLAAAKGCAVAAVIDGQHSGNEQMVDVVKGLTGEPGFAVAEEYALCKANFRDLVQRTAEGEDTAKEGFDSGRFLSDFKTNLLDYVEYYPDDLPAAVDSEQLRFVGKEKDRANFKVNMEAYLSQYAPGAAPIDEARLDALFTVEQYEAFKKKFGVQTTAVISGGDGKSDIDRFAPAEIVSNMIASPESVPDTDNNSEDSYPFEFSVSSPSPSITTQLKGGPISGLIIEVTPELSAAAEALAKVKTLRQKAEALQFLTEGQRNAHAAACSLVSLAKASKAPIRTVSGSLPGLDSVAPNEMDVQTALDGMAMNEEGDSILNYFIQVYRAGDFEAYEHYGILRASEPCAGPRQIVVTK